jgi:hypothetical protein
MIFMTRKVNYSNILSPLISYQICTRLLNNIMEIIVYMGKNGEKEGINGRDHIRLINQK